MLFLNIFSALLLLVVELLLMKETISFKDHIYFIKKPIPVMKNNDFDISESTTQGMHLLALPGFDNPQLSKM